jgi:hypothetical protein
MDDPRENEAKPLNEEREISAKKSRITDCTYDSETYGFQMIGFDN